MHQIHRAVAVLSAVIAAGWGRLQAVFASEPARAAVARRAQLTSIRRRYALGAASREQLDTAMRTLGSRVRRGRGPRRRKAA